jgi:DNA-binding phage protein
MPTTKSYHSYLIESLKDPTEAAAYLNATLEERDTELLLLAIKNVAEANSSTTSFSQTAQLNKAESSELHRLGTLLDTLGLKLIIALK